MSNDLTNDLTFFSFWALCIENKLHKQMGGTACLYFPWQADHALDAMTPKGAMAGQCYMYQRAAPRCHPFDQD
jgi:putative component of membrane protein insertase Oxa1/YidC/SpoIIIJ protein YidD